VRRLALVAVVIVSCAPSPTQTATPAAGQTLKLVFHAGAVYRFSLHSIQSLATGTDPASQFEFTAQETATVQSVDATGTADIDVSLSNVVALSGAVGGQTDTSRPAFDVKIAPDGRILSMDGPAMASKFPFRTGFDANLIVAVLPDVQVMPGDTWTKEYDQLNPFGAGSGTIHIQTASKYLRDESINGVGAAVVETTSEATIDTTESVGVGAPTPGSPSYPLLPGGVTGFALTGTTSTDVTTWIDPSGHGIMKTHITAKTAASIGTVVAPGAPTPAAGSLSSEADESVDLARI
jgi:hypothetical protein